MKYPIGTKFIARSDRKSRRVQTVIDYHTTRNLAGEIVRERYVATHTLCGQPITNADILETTIAMGEIQQ